MPLHPMVRGNVGRMWGKFEGLPLAESFQRKPLKPTPHVGVRFPMPKIAKQLSALEVRRLKQPGLHAVGGVPGLHLQVQHPRSRCWILRVVVGSRRRDIGLGGYPSVNLKDARERAVELRESIFEKGKDPIEVKREAKAALIAAEATRKTFDEAMHACWRSKSKEFKNTKHAQQWLATLRRYASPVIGRLPVAEVELAQVICILEPIWESKTETASRVRGRLEAVLAWATVNGYRSGDNPAAWRGNLEHALPKPSKVRKVKHHAALPWTSVPAFMAELRLRTGMAPRALELAVLTAARSGEVRLAKWDEIDLKAREWVIPGDRMKAGKRHRVPLSLAAVRLLAALPRMADSDYVFPGPKGGPMTDMSLSAVCRRMKVDAVPHGFRSSFKDWARNRAKQPDEVSELALAHVSSDATRAAYARDELMPQRKQLMRDWARFLSGSVQRKSKTRKR